MKKWILSFITYPLIIVLAKLFPKQKEALERWFIEKNNKITQQSFKKKPENVLLLLPHCLQNDDCEHRLLKTIQNCKNCGKCDIGNLMNLTEKFGIMAKVASGGRLAKRWILEIKPDFIIAVACEKELLEGIAAVYPFNVIGVINARPNGPCINTRVDAKNVEKILQKITKRETK
ncbi:MAG: hypothetical protein A2252_02670 [Elusimicrobia bacterium RIFOXYA2_FULL_39_19]|nr:MAG: hypothetical protein A2252_02670 [Elusimicrobia bacterium RIFOXYA2_FULL_39_19]